MIYDILQCTSFFEGKECKESVIVTRSIDLPFTPAKGDSIVLEGFCGSFTVRQRSYDLETGKTSVFMDGWTLPVDHKYDFVKSMKASGWNVQHHPHQLVWL